MHTYLVIDNLRNDVLAECNTIEEAEAFISGHIKADLSHAVNTNIEDAQMGLASYVVAVIISYNAACGVDEPVKFERHAEVKELK